MRFNSLRHGLAAKNAVLAGESEEHFRETLEAFQAEYQPLGPTEILLVDQMVVAAWRIQRLRGIETGVFNIRMCDLKEQLACKYSSPDQYDPHAYAFLDDTRGACAIEHLLRYETRIERSFYRALQELQFLQAGRQTASDPPVAPEALPPAESDFAEQTHSQNRTLEPVE